MLNGTARLIEIGVGILSTSDQQLLGNSSQTDAESKRTIAHSVTFHWLERGGASPVDFGTAIPSVVRRREFCWPVSLINYARWHRSAPITANVHVNCFARGQQQKHVESAEEHKTWQQRYIIWSMEPAPKSAGSGGRFEGGGRALRPPSNLSGGVGKRLVIKWSPKTVVTLGSSPTETPVTKLASLPSIFVLSPPLQSTVLIFHKQCTKWQMHWHGLPQRGR